MVESRDRSVHLQHALRLEYITVGWNVIEGVVAIGAAIASGSVALLGFGIDSFVESASGGVLIWRLGAERQGIDACQLEALDRRAHKLVALSLFLLGAYVAGDAAHALWTAERPDPSIVGITLTIVSIGVMRWLAAAKRQAAHDLGSRALAADAFQSTACWWLSIAALGGMGLNAALGWWWADPLAAVVMAGLILKEGRQAWKGDGCCGPASGIPNAPPEDGA